MQQTRCTGITKNNTRCQRKPAWGQTVCHKHGAQPSDQCVLCHHPAYNSNLCTSHNMRWHRYGDPHKGGTRRGEPLEWIMNQLENGDRTECWLWPYAIATAGGHGSYMWKGRTQTAHIAVKELDGHPKPEGMQGNHHCDNPPCVNPDHVYYGDKRQNELDTLRSGTHTRGSRNGNAKLTPEQVRDVRKRYEAGESQRSLSACVGVDQATISRLTRGLAYADVS